MCWLTRALLAFIGTSVMGISSGCVLPTGVLRSRWAMDNEVYAEKYAEGATKTDVAGKIKQAADARFVSGSAGLYVSGGVASRPEADSELGGIDIGIEGYATSYLTTRGSLMFMSDGDDWFTGADVGARVQTPTRLAPFAGAGVFLGAASERVAAENDWVDNDDDGAIDERGEKRTRFNGALAAVYPELGMHFWWTPNVRLTGYGRYMITSEGRDDDDWMIGAGLAVFNE